MIDSMKVLSMILAGFVVGYAVSDIRPFDSLLSSTAEFGSPTTIVNGLTVLALTACLVSVALARSSARGVLVVAIGAVLVVVFRTVGMVTGMFGDWAGAVGAGALLGASAVLAGRHRGAQASLAVAAIGAGLLGTALDALLQADDGPVFVWDVVGAEDAVVPERAIVMVIAALGTALSLYQAHRDVALQSHETRRTLLVGLPLPIAAGVVSWFAGGHDSGDAVWLGALAGMAVLAVVAAFAFPGRDGRVLLVLFASATIGSMGFVEDSLQLAVSVALLVVGAGIGYRWPQLYVGLGGLLVVAGASLIEGYVALPSLSQFALPFVVAYALVSVLSTAPGSLAVALPALFTMSLPVTVFAASYQAGLSLSSDAVATRTSEPDHLVLSLAGLVVVAVVTVACAVLMRRPTQNPAAR